MIHDDPDLWATMADDPDIWTPSYPCGQRLMIQTLRSRSTIDAEHMVSIKHGITKEQMEHFRSTRSQICNLLENHRPPTGHFCFELATFSDKNRHIHCHTPPVPIISYGRISPPLAINPLGDKPAWR